jgi:hypothetical protein
MEKIKKIVDKIITKSYQKTSNEYSRLYSIHKQINNIYLRKEIIYEQPELREKLRLSFLYLVQNYLSKITFDLSKKVYKQYSQLNIFKVQKIHQEITDAEINLLRDKYFIESIKILLDTILEFIEEYNENQITIDEYLTKLMDKRCKL